jgi:hypothetical protein
VWNYIFFQLKTQDDTTDHDAAAAENPVPFFILLSASFQELSTESTEKKNALNQTISFLTESYRIYV